MVGAAMAVGAAIVVGAATVVGAAMAVGATIVVGAATVVGAAEVMVTGATVSASPLHPKATKRNIRAIGYFFMTVSMSLSRHHHKHSENSASRSWLYRAYQTKIRNLTGNHLNPNSIMNAFKALGERFNMPDAPLHGLRHTHATLLLEEGIEREVVQKRLGHTSIVVTSDIYSRAARRLQRKAADAFEEILINE